MSESILDLFVPPVKSPAQNKSAGDQRRRREERDTREWMNRLTFLMNQGPHDGVRWFFDVAIEDGDVEGCAEMGNRLCAVGDVPADGRAARQRAHGLGEQLAPASCPTSQLRGGGGDAWP